MYNFFFTLIIIISIIFVAFSFQAILYFFDIKSNKEHIFYLVWFLLLLLLYFILPKNYKFFQN